VPKQSYNDNVFVNCPFDEAYKPLFNALVFAVYDCGFVARCALEESDASRIRVQKIFEIISKCRLGIHDISRIELDKSTKLPRFNMPLELGAFLGAKHFGKDIQKRKSGLILDTERYRFQKFISDIAGQDIQAHESDPRKLVRLIRNWLQNYSKAILPSGSIIWKRYQLFQKELPLLCKDLKLDAKELTFNDYVLLVSRWLKINA
jgi:hypothetical protein